MTIARLSAGAGYRYLTRSTACADTDLGAGADLGSYYAASGNPPGRWYGSGLAALGGDIPAGGASGPGDTGAVTGLRAGDVVTEEGMARLFGAGRDPVTGAPLGRAFPVFAPAADRVARRVTALPGDLPEADRVAAVAAIEAEEAARRPRQPVAGFDLTFSARKSVSVLWALGDDATRQAVYEAHQRALADVIAYAEATAVFTRTGKAGDVRRLWPPSIRGGRPNHAADKNMIIPTATPAISPGRPITSTVIRMFRITMSVQ